MKFDINKLAKQAVVSCRIGQKPNKGIEKARKKYGTFVDILLKKKRFRLSTFPEKKQKIIRELSSYKFGPLVYETTQKGVYKVKTKVGESVRIAYAETDPVCVRLAKKIREECWKRGAHVSMLPASDRDSRKAYQLKPEETLAEIPPLVEAAIKNTDVTIYVGDREDRQWGKGLEQKMRVGSPASMKLYEIRERHKVRWCLVGYPVRMKQERDYVVPRRTYEQVYKDTLMTTFTQKIQKVGRYYKKALEGADRVHITAKDGTDLKMRIKGRPVLFSDGIIDDEDMKQGDIGLNIPDGETFLAPLEHSANGKIKFDYVNTSGFGMVHDLWLTFEKGKVVDFKAGNSKETKRFKKFLRSNTGEKDRIAELGIGCNPAAKFIGTIIVDEKIYGSIHIAIGGNYGGTFHGKNKASSHLDMIKIMKGKCGRMYVDGKLVMKNGEPVFK